MRGRQASAAFPRSDPIALTDVKVPRPLREQQSLNQRRASAGGFGRGCGDGS
jgi:hypothetical protein